MSPGAGAALRRLLYRSALGVEPLPAARQPRGYEMELKSRLVGRDFESASLLNSVLQHALQLQQSEVVGWPKCMKQHGIH